MYSYKVKQDSDGTFSYTIYKTYQGREFGYGFGSGYKTRAEAEQAAEQQIRYL